MSFYPRDLIELGSTPATRIPARATRSPATRVPVCRACQVLSSDVQSAEIRQSSEDDIYSYSMFPSVVPFHEIAIAFLLTGLFLQPMQVQPGFSHTSKP